MHALKEIRKTIAARDVGYEPVYRLIDSPEIVALRMLANLAKFVESSQFSSKPMTLPNASLVPRPFSAVPPFIGSVGRTVEKGLGRRLTKCCVV